MSKSGSPIARVDSALARRTRSDIVLMDIDNLFHHPANPRKDIGDIEELTDSIRENGVMQNLTIIPQQFWDETWDEDDVEEIKKDVEDDLAVDNVGTFFYVLIGNRRFEASKAAGLEKLPCRIVYGLSKDKQLGLMLAENIQRSDLTIPEQAYGFQQMLELGEDVDSISDMTGFSKSTIYHRLNIAKLDKAAVEDAINNHQLNMNDFIKLEGIDDEEERNKIIKDYPTQIDYRVDLYKKEKAKEKWQKEIFSKLQQEFLVEKFPEGARTWDKCWNLITRLAVGEEVELEIFEKKDIFYTTDWSGGLTLYQYDEEAAELAKSEASKPDEFDEQRKAREAIDKVKEILDKQLIDFFSYLAKEEVDKQTDSDYDIYDVNLLWEAIVSVYGSYSLDLEGVLTRFFDWDNYEQEEVKKKLSPALYMGLVLADAAIDSNTRDYRAVFDQKDAKDINEIIDVLSDVFAFTIDDEDGQIAKLLDGTLEHYREDK